ncbi:alpha/beta hydrolase family protein [[Mycobacterium] burgundiense]|uniref:Alpha/beta fold hydrolase n=1 Tax=[Mycobacterium] burgundiense TaxID=3064286 RepID=A0ABM9M6W9_9MYCO|nr:alpha/beta fold hydrolase [Mycolicibacterium sp. MU0053]CAJ1510924.1 alpha/beta fold hydrolase [Mycolicibacterium sp. MU0053]
MNTVEYTTGRFADVFGEASGPTVLLWHGTQTDARATVRPLAQLLADRGLGVVAPDWNSHAADRGRSDLLSSVEFARSRSDRLVLVGWSLGGVAAAGLTIGAPEYGVDLAHTVCLAGAFMVPDPISGEQLRPQLSGERTGAPFTLLHGLADDVVPAQTSRSFAADLDQAGWPVRLVELEADHGNIAGARYDAAADRYEPAHDPATRQVAGTVADHIAGVAMEPPATG